MYFISYLGNLQPYENHNLWAFQEQKQSIEENEVLRIFSQTVSGLAYMHARKILHRDLKSQNIFMTKEGIIKIGDLGIAKVMATQNQTVVGTCSYISPELCEAKKEWKIRFRQASIKVSMKWHQVISQIIFHSYQRYDGKSDIWSLGCVLYEICAQRKTFDGDNPLAIVRKIMAVQYEPLSKKLPYTNKVRFNWFSTL